jgi:hypothetical protein
VARKSGKHQSVSWKNSTIKKSLRTFSRNPEEGRLEFFLCEKRTEPFITIIEKYF